LEETAEAMFFHVQFRDFNSKFLDFLKSESIKVFPQGWLKKVEQTVDAHI
jgi:hypothetical protein